MAVTIYNPCHHFLCVLFWSCHIAKIHRHVYVHVCVCISVYPLLKSNNCSLSPLFPRFYIKKNPNSPLFPSVAFRLSSSSHEQQALWAVCPNVFFPSLSLTQPCLYSSTHPPPSLTSIPCSKTPVAKAKYSLMVVTEE